MTDDATRAVLAQALAFFRSVILSGEQWTEECDRMYNDAKARIAELERDAKRLDWLEQIRHEAIEIESFGDPVMIDWAGERDNPRIATESTLRTAIDAGMVRYPLRNAEATHD